MILQGKIKQKNLAEKRVSKWLTPKKEMKMVCAVFAQMYLNVHNVF